MQMDACKKGVGINVSQDRFKVSASLLPCMYALMILIFDIDRKPHWNS